MTLTRERPDLDHFDYREIEIPESWRLSPPRPPRDPWPERVVRFLAAPISPARALVTLVGWMVLFGVALAVEPPPADPEVALGAYEVVFPLLLLGAIGTMWAGLAHARRWGAIAAVAASALWLYGTAVCLSSGHHAFGAWWVAQAGLGVGAMGLAVWALRRA